jgi:GTPase involved in cell partitioning and DNA repair
VIELASFGEFSETHLDFLGQLTESIGIVLNTIEANTSTEELLAQSQSLTDELRITNEELQDKAHLLAKQKQEVEAKNNEVEEARKSLEEKAEQLQLLQSTNLSSWRTCRMSYVRR